MNNRLQVIFVNLFVIFCLTIYSCNTQSDKLLSIGDNFLNSNTRLTKVDTFAISLSTIIIDSVATSNSEIAIVGQYLDDNTGTINANSFFQIGIPSNNTIQVEDIFDSVALVLNYSSYYYGDTTQIFSLSAYEVTEEMELNEDGYLYNNSSFNYNTIMPLGTKTFYPRPKNEGEVIIKLMDSFGIDLFEKLKNDEDEVDNQTEFINYLKGIVLASDNDINKAIMGFGLTDSTLNLRLYGHRTEEEFTEIEINFPVINNSLRFNQLTSDKSNTNLAELVDQKNALHSSLTNNVTYIKGGTGLMTTIAFPGLKSLIEINDGDIFKAELVLHPIINDKNSKFFPSDFFLYEGGKYNTLEGTYLNAEGSTYFGTVEKDDMFNDISITFDLTDYIKLEIADSYYDNEVLFILSYANPSYNSSINPVEIGGFENEHYKPSLNIYYIHYDTY